MGVAGGSRFRVVPQELVAQCNGVVRTIVSVCHPGVAGIPRHIGQPLDLVAREPCGGHLVGRSFLKVEVTAEEVITAVACQIGIAAALFLSGDDKRGIQLGESLSVAFFRTVDGSGRRLTVGVGALVEVGRTGVQAAHGQGDDNDMFCIHCFRCFRNQVQWSENRYGDADTHSCLCRPGIRDLLRYSR